MNETKQLSAEQEQAGVIVRLREEIASLKTEAERDKGAARLAFDTLAEERDHLKAERERHIEAAAHKELDWFAEKRRADLLEAKCAELWQLLETVKYRIDLPAPNISGSNGLRKLLETLPNNPGQLLLDRLAKAEAKCAVADEIVTYVKEGYVTDSRLRRAITTYKKDNAGQPLLERLKGTEECRDHYMNLLAEEVKLSNSLQERLEKLRRAVEAVPPAWAGYKDWREGVDKPLAACEPKERG